MLAQRVLRGLPRSCNLNRLAPLCKIAWRPQSLLLPKRLFSEELPASKDTTFLLKQIIQQEMTEEDLELQESKSEIQKLRTDGILKTWSLKQPQSGVALQELTRSFGDEQIQVKFHVQDCEVDEEGEEEMDEEDDAQDDDAHVDHDLDVSYNFTVAIKRPGKKNLEFACNCSGNDASLGQFDIRSVRIVRDDAGSSEGTNYDGPEFADLVEELQDQFYEFLAQRGVDEHVAEFIAKYVEVRERELYREWLETLHETVGNGE